MEREMGEAPMTRTTGRHVLLRLSVLSVALVSVAAVLLAGPLGSAEVLVGAPFVLNWWTIALLFALGELLEVPLESRGEAHSLTFKEIAFVIGLALASRDELVVGRVLGGPVVLVVILLRSLARRSVGMGKR